MLIVSLDPPLRRGSEFELPPSEGANQKISIKGLGILKKGES